MRRTWLGVLFALTAAGFLGCATAKPLKLSYYSRNLIIDKGDVIRVEKDVVPLDNLRQDMVNRGIKEDSPIIVHVHHDVSPSFFDAVVDKLKAEGFRNFSIDFFTD